MSISITMPALSPTMEAGNIARWLKKEGDFIKVGDAIAEIETDKATMEIEAFDEGILTRILVPAGTADVPVNEVIALLARSVSVDETPNEIPAASGAGTAETVVTSLLKSDRVFISPLARRQAQQARMSYVGVAGSGPRGRIIARDIEQAVASALRQSGERPVLSQPATEAASPPDRPSADRSSIDFLFKPGSYIELPVDQIRWAIARRVVESKRTVPHFYLTMDCQVDALLALRRQINDEARIVDGNPSHRLTINDFVVKAVALALQNVPACNVVWFDDRILQFIHSDVGVAVAVEGGLFVPIVRKAESKTLTAISAEVKDLAVRSREYRLRPGEYEGGSAAISNLGMYGITSFQPIINPPHAVIFGIGAATERLVAKNGQAAVVRAFTVTMSCDHRAVDGAVAAQALAALKDLIEKPMGMLV